MFTLLILGASDGGAGYCKVSKPPTSDRQNDGKAAYETIKNSVTPGLTSGTIQYEKLDQTQPSVHESEYEAMASGNNTGEKTFYSLR